MCERTSHHINQNKLFTEFTTARKANRYCMSLGSAFRNPWGNIVQFCCATSCCPSKAVRLIKEHCINSICSFGVIFL